MGVIVSYTPTDGWYHISYEDGDEEDGGADGVPDYIYEYTYNENGNWIGLVITYSFGYEIVLTASYDENGNQISQTQDNGNDGSLEYHWTTAYGMGYYDCDTEQSE